MIRIVAKQLFFDRKIVATPGPGHMLLQAEAWRPARDGRGLEFIPGIPA